MINNKNNYEKNFYSNLSGSWIDNIYQKSLQNTESVSIEWLHFFAGFEFAIDSPTIRNTSTTVDSALSRKQIGIQSLINQYRTLGHLLACTDPLSPCMLDHPLLTLSNFDLDDSDLNIVFTTQRFIRQNATLREILYIMRETYCREIGVEFMHIQDTNERQWLIDRMESCLNRPVLQEDEKIHLLTKLHEASNFESFLQRRFTGQKRFSLEGGEVLVPVLDAIVRTSPIHRITSVILGMAHRGRLNVLAHTMMKPYENIFAEFRDEMEIGFVGDGDVKYHKGYSADVICSAGTVHVSLASNPSHLEAVNPVVEGKCRARQDYCGSTGRQNVLPVLIHGDGAFAGQGSIMELLNLSRLDGYSTGGTIHIILNNQIGFTTEPRDARSTLYATDIAKMLACPIFHVQGESPESALHVVKLAMEYRQEYGRDVVIELVCYRRYGHNEGDEPAFTQPVMYRQIKSRPAINRLYSDFLAESGVSRSVLDEIEHSVVDRLEASFNTPPQLRSIGFHDTWSALDSEFSSENVDTNVSAETLLLLSRRLAELPPGFNAHDKIQALIQKRFEAVLKKSGIDWGNAEVLAYATLLDEGISVRLSGQDSCRGTFSHRHCVLHDGIDGTRYVPLSALARDGASFQAWDSPLSEFGVLGFEYGYSLESPLGLTIWEAQFGDFANGAQVVIDQFIVSGETKWNRASGLVLLLPHGYEGQGAEHSSARIERFLQLCAGNNIILANPSTPAQMFHLLRRQVKRSFRKPLIIFTPKSLLRHPECVSSVEAICDGTFHEILADQVNPDFVRRVLICSGKIYYDLLDELNRRGVSDVCIIRIEQLYPLRIDLIDAELMRLSGAARFVWVQEEPENMGAWQHVRTILTGRFSQILYVGRPADSCPAVGSHRLHLEQQAEIVKLAFEI